MMGEFMQKLEADSPETKSADIVADNVEAMKAMFPEAFTEGRIDFEVLKGLLGAAVDERDEKYGLNWHGKRRARQTALTPSAGTLLPCPDESVDWDTTQNLMIEGDNLEVLKLLQKSYSRKVKLIYIDPPYNTGRDLIYPNDFRDGITNYLEVTGQLEGGKKLTSNPETGGRYHSNWLNLMYPRLRLAKNLLSNSGVLICTIDENEQTNLGSILKEVFDEGSYEHVCVTIIHNPRGIQGTNFSYTHEYAFFVYPRGQKCIGTRKIEDSEVSWSHLRNWGSESERADAKNCFYPIVVRDGEIAGFGDVCSDDIHPRQTEFQGNVAYVYPIDRAGVERKWRYARQSVEAIRKLLRVRKTESRYEVEIGKDFGLYRTVWTDKRYDANEYGTKIVSSLVPDSPFAFPKSLWAVYDCLFAVVADDKDAIILDFFAGSGTTGHATLEVNKDDGGKRRYILVQLPEKLEESKRYRTIADVTKERMRGAGRSIKEASPMFGGDIGFRVFRLASSNIRAWDPDPADVESSLLKNAEHLVEGRNEQDVLYELLLKLGLDLCVPIETQTLAGKVVHSIGGGALIACLADGLTKDVIEPLSSGIVAWRKELAPAVDTRIVFKDSGFADDIAKTNMAAILNQNGISDVRSL
jgi:adenine-specific DNA-methyltransferase